MKLEFSAQCYTQQLFRQTECVYNMAITYSIN